MENSYISLVRHMPSVIEYEATATHQLDDWNTLDRLARINNTGLSIGKTKEEFKQLSELLEHNLAQETINNLLQKITSKAQITVDIVIRNLFERTADIGFLSTDKDIKEFLESSYEARKLSRKTLEKRFCEYVAKYSVYDDIVLVDTHGKICASLASMSQKSFANEKLLKKVQEANGDFVETFGPCPFQPHKNVALSYACSVLSDDNKQLGALILFFKFEDELEGVFSHLLDKNDWSVLTLLNHKGEVIASSDTWQIPLHVKLETHLKKGLGIARFGGREYIIKTCPTKGYEGYMGLGWLGHAMIPIEHAFSAQKNQMLTHIDKEKLTQVMQTSQLFSEQIKSIPMKATKIQKELDRTVHNGKLMDETGTIGMVLGEISRAGTITKEIFEKAIQKLNETIISTLLDDASFAAALAIDIMDRNLYERANDCRWWALADDFRRILKDDDIDIKAKEHLSSILNYINNLYTVYTNLILYDKSGKIIAISSSRGGESWQLEPQSWIEKTLNYTWVSQTLKLHDSQHYVVSSFESDPLYRQGDWTYIYNAAIYSLDNNESIGGIGIIFDATPQFQGMLTDALPKDTNGSIKEGCFGFFVSRSGQIISATQPSKYPIGSTLEVPKSLLELKNGSLNATLCTHEGKNYVIGASCSNGYREFKSQTDVYKNDVISLVYLPTGDNNTPNQNQDEKPKNPLQIPIPKSLEIEKDQTKVITFEIDSEWFGLRANNCECVLSVEGMTPILTKEYGYVVGFMTYKEKTLYIVNLTGKLEPSNKEINPDDEIIVVRIEGSLHLHYIGIITSCISEIKTIPNSLIDPLTGLVGVMDLFSEAVIRNPQNANAKMVTLLSSQKIANRLVDPDRQRIKSIWDT